MDNRQKAIELLKTELKASDNWLHRLLKSCVIFLDDGEVTKRAVEKQSRYNLKALATLDESKPVCKTCGGKGKKIISGNWGMVHKEIPCPDCQSEPPKKKTKIVLCHGEREFGGDASTAREIDCKS